MTQICTICKNAKRLEIDRLIVEGRGLTDIAKEFDVSYQSLWNHSQNHVTRQLAQAWDKIQLQQDFDLLGRIDKIISRCEDIFTRNYEAGHDITALKALTEQRSTVELIAKISYNLHQAKIAELQLIKEKSGETEGQLKEEFQKMLTVLSIEELNVYQRIQNKLLHQNTDIIISGNKVLVYNNNLSKDLTVN